MKDRRLPRVCWIKCVCGTVPFMVSYREGILHGWATDGRGGTNMPVGIVEHLGLDTDGVPYLTSVGISSIALEKPHKLKSTTL